LAKQAVRLHAIPWSGVILDEAHFIKNASGRTSHVMRLLGVSENARNPVLGPSQVYLLTGTPMTNRPRDLYNLLRCVGHPASRSFLSFAKQYCGAYRNDFGWVTDGASNLDELNLLMKEVMLRRKKDEVLDLPPKVRSWVPVAVEGASLLNAHRRFANWLAASDPSKPNDTAFLGELQRVRVALHKAKQRAVAERIQDVLATGQKVIVFTAFTDGLRKHAATLGDACVTISGDQDAEARMQAVDAFQTDDRIRVAVCNLIAGGVGITLTAGTHVIFQDLDWVPANHAQAEDRAYRLGQKYRVTVEYILGEGTLDTYVADLLSTKMALIQAVEMDEAPDASILADLEARLRALGPAFLLEQRAAAATGDAAARIAALGAVLPRGAQVAEVDQSGVHEFTSAREPGKVYRVTWGRGGHLECTCEGFRWRGDCKHVREVRAKGS
jgi:SWI/SNF-related matrix-associated actin-dependent regulator 1 of chromatin subfamily A